MNKYYLRLRGWCVALNPMTRNWLYWVGPHDLLLTLYQKRLKDRKRRAYIKTALDALHKFRDNHLFDIRDWLSYEDLGYILITRREYLKNGEHKVNREMEDKVEKWIALIEKRLQL